MQGQVKGLFLVRALLLACRCRLLAGLLSVYAQGDRERDGGMDGGRKGHGGRGGKEREMGREREIK